MFPDLVLALGFPGTLTRDEPFYLEDAKRGLTTSRIAFSSRSVRSTVEVLKYNEFRAGRVQPS